jgi:hypothetical protein
MWLLLPPLSHVSFDMILMLLVSSLVLAIFFLWTLRAHLQGDWQAWGRDYALSVQRDAGVVVEEFPFRKPKLWVWIALPGCMLVTACAALLLPVRIQPLVIAGGMLLVGLVKHGQDKRAFGLVHFLSFAPYWAYAFACAAGLHQPFINDPILCIGIPLLLFAILPAAVVCELYSRSQFRRLQRLLEDTGERKPDAGD